jgi:hypothetical protein
MCSDQIRIIGTSLTLDCFHFLCQKYLKSAQLAILKYTINCDHSQFPYCAICRTFDVIPPIQLHSGTISYPPASSSTPFPGKHFL